MNTFENEWTKEIDRLQAEKAELLKALKNMVREWVEIVGDETENSTPADTLEKARAAIAKAERGE